MIKLAAAFLIQARQFVRELAECKLFGGAENSDTGRIKPLGAVL
jgi:hypothetical protein